MQRLLLQGHYMTSLPVASSSQERVVHCLLLQRHLRGEVCSIKDILAVKEDDFEWTDQQKKFG